MDSDLIWSDRFRRDIQYGYVGSQTEPGSTVEMRGLSGS